MVPALESQALPAVNQLEETMNVVYMEDAHTHELLAFVTFVGHRFWYKLGTKDEVESLQTEQLETLIIGVVLNSDTRGETVH